MTAGGISLYISTTSRFGCVQQEKAFLSLSLPHSTPLRLGIAPVRKERRKKGLLLRDFFKERKICLTKVRVFKVPLLWCLERVWFPKTVRKEGRKEGRSLALRCLIRAPSERTSSQDEKKTRKRRRYSPPPPSSS